MLFVDWDRFFMIKLNKYSVLMVVAVLTAIATITIIALAFFGANFGKIAPFLNFGSGASSESIASQSVDYLNNNILSSEGRTATLISFSDEEGLVKMNIEIDGQNYNSYATKSGKLFFPAVIEMNLGVNN